MKSQTYLGIYNKFVLSIDSLILSHVALMINKSVLLNLLLNMFGAAVFLSNYILPTSSDASTARSNIRLPLSREALPPQRMNHTERNHNGQQLQRDYMEANPVTQLRLERNRLKILEESIKLKRPIQSIRLNGLSGLPVEKARNLIQECETKATILAIELKKASINQLRSFLKRNRNVSYPINDRLIKHHDLKTNRKINFLKECDTSKFSDWKPKNKFANISSITNHIDSIRKKTTIKAKKAMKKIKRRDAKQRSELHNRAQTVVDGNQVVNVTDTTIPPFSLAVLGYGPGWVPSPSFDELQFRVDAHNAANKLCWSVFLNNNNQPDTQDSIPSTLLKRPVTSECTEIPDGVIKQISYKIKTLLTTCNQDFIEKI